VLAGPRGWRSDLKAFGELPAQDGHRTWWEQDRQGQKIRFELIGVSPPNRRVVRIADRNRPFGGSWTFEITPAAGGSELRIHENGEIYNMIFRFRGPFVFGYTASIERVLRELGTKLGQDVSIEP